MRDIKQHVVSWGLWYIARKLAKYANHNYTYIHVLDSHTYHFYAAHYLSETLGNFS